MANRKLETPVVLVLFNRPEKTAEVLNAIRQAQPTQLFVIADGPRQNRSGEAELCEHARKVIESVDWDCKIFKNYSETNLGCKQRIGGTGLPWVFEQVETAIILEDDCVPDLSFFYFCEELLEKYRDDPEVMAICGHNPLIRWRHKKQSYLFSYQFNCWGWATWRRVWDIYDISLDKWKIPENELKVRDRLVDREEFKVLKHELNRVYSKHINSWAYQMTFLCHYVSGIVVVPTCNLISNVGFGAEATRTSSADNVNANLPAYSVEFPLIEPRSKAVDLDYERRRFFKLLDRRLPAKIYRKLIRLTEILGK